MNGSFNIELNGTIMFQKWFSDKLTKILASSWCHLLMFYFCLITVWKHQNIKFESKTKTTI
jgi:hypothetical protein